MPQLQPSYRQANKNRQKTKPEHLRVGRSIQILHLFLPAIAINQWVKHWTNILQVKRTGPIALENLIQLTFHVEHTSRHGWIVLCRTFSSVLFPLTDPTGKTNTVNDQDRQKAYNLQVSSILSYQMSQTFLKNYINRIQLHESKRGNCWSTKARVNIWKFKYFENVDKRKQFNLQRDMQ